MTSGNAETRKLRSWQLNLLGVGGFALVVAWFMAGTDSVEFYRGWLIGYLLGWEIAIGCLGMLMLHHLMGGNWGRSSRSVLEAGAGLLPLAAVAFLPIAINVGQLFPWTGGAAAEDPLIAQKAAYLNEQAFWIRAAVYFGVWAISWRMLVPIMKRASDAEGRRVLLPRRSALGLMLLIVAVSFAAIDWGMSLEPHWFSAIYGAIYVAGAAVMGMATTIVAVAALRLGRPVAGVSSRRIRNDLGSIMLAMLMIWTYFTFSQFLIIWSANLPEENVWYLTRGRNGWHIVAVVVVVLHFVVPFAALISHDVRANPRMLAAVAGIVLAAHALFIVWLIAPAFYEAVSDVSWSALAAIVGLYCLWSAGWLFLLERHQIASWQPT